MIFAISLSIRIISRLSSASSSLTRLFASTTSVGSTKRVFPEADSSCTIPFILRFIVGTIGITSLPSRIDGVTSFSIRPSLCAERKILYNVCEMLPSVLASSLRMLLSSGDAVSRIFPNLSNI